MYRYLPPLCLFLALVLLISGFALLAAGAPEAGMELHRARVGGEEQYSELLEERLQRGSGNGRVRENVRTEACGDVRLDVVIGLALLSGHVDSLSDS